MEIVSKKSMLELLKQTQHSIDWITFGETGNWDYLELPIKIWIHNSIVKAVLLYNAETWSLTKAENQRLEPAHHI